MSVIRRKHTTNFTTISNALRDDTRLQADEVGILYYLLTQPHDWEIRRPQLRKRFNIGRDGMKRIMDNWLRTGWLHAEKTRLSNGQFTIVYEVQDEPGSELSSADVRAALSVVSTEVDGDNSPECDVPATGPPLTPQPYLDSHPPDSRASKESLNIDSQNTKPTKGVPVWRDVRDAWPHSEIRSLFKCEQLYASLSQDDRQKAFDGIKSYLSRCRERNQKVCDLSTYLKERRFETIKANRSNDPIFTCKLPMPEAARWLEYYRAVGTNKFAIHQLEHGNAIAVPTQWPPALPPPTGPPLPSLPSFDDLEDEERG